MQLELGLELQLDLRLEVEVNVELDLLMRRVSKARLQALVQQRFGRRQRPPACGKRSSTTGSLR